MVGYVLCFLLGVVIVILLSSFHRLGKEYATNEELSERLGIETSKSHGTTSLAIRLKRSDSGDNSYIHVYVSGTFKLLTREKDVIFSTHLSDVTNPMRKVPVKIVELETNQVKDFSRRKDYYKTLDETRSLHHIEEEQHVAVIPLNQLVAAKTGERKLSVSVQVVEEVGFQQFRRLGRQTTTFTHFQD